MEQRGRKFKHVENAQMLMGSPNDNDVRGLCTVPEKAKSSGYSSQTIYEWIRKGYIQSYFFENDPIKRVFIDVDVNYPPKKGVIQ